MEVRYANKDEKNIAINFWKESFKDTDEQINFYFNEIFDHNNYLILEDEEKIVSSLHENPYILNFNSQKIDTKYIVGVSSDISLRNKGYMKYLLTSMLTLSKRKNLPFVFLTPINPEIYRKFDFEYFSNIEYYSFSIEELIEFKKPSNNYGYLKINEKNIKFCVKDLIKIYNFNMKNNFSYLERDEYYFKKLLKETFVDEMKTYILYKDNIPSAYIIYGLENDTVEIRECFAMDPTSYKEILSLIYGYRDYYSKVNLASPKGSNINFIFSNQLKIERKILPFMMLRILNPINVFKILNLENTNLKISIIDKTLSENTGLYILNKDITFSKDINEADIEIDIKDLVFLVSGYFSVDELLKLNKIKILESNKENALIEKLSKIFKKKKSYLYEFL